MPLPCHPIVKKSKMRAAGSRATALATLVLVTRPKLLPACVHATPEEKKMQLPHAPISSHRRLIWRFLGADFDRLLLSLRHVHSRRLRPAGRLTCCRVQGSRGAARRHWGQLDLWTRQVGRRQVRSITLAGGDVRIDRARSLRATTGSTGHRSSHCRTTEKESTPLPRHPIIQKKMRAAGARDS